MKFEDTTDLINELAGDAVATITPGDCGAIIATCMREAGLDYEGASAVIKLAIQVLSHRPGGQDAAKCFKGALDMLEVWSDPL